MSENVLSLEKRVESGKKVKAVRKAGLVPSVVYGGGREDILAKSGYNETEKVLRTVGYHSPVDLMIDGKKQLAMVKNVSVDPVKRRIVNVEFLAVSADKMVEAVAPIILVGLGESEAEKAKLSILQAVDEVEVKAKPADLPKGIEVDITGLKEVGDKVTLADLKLPKGVELADKELDLTDAVANVYDAAAEKARADAEAEAEKAKVAEGTAVEGEAGVEGEKAEGGGAEKAE